MMARVMVCAHCRRQNCDAVEYETPAMSGLDFDIAPRIVCRNSEGVEFEDGKPAFYKVVIAHGISNRYPLTLRKPT